MKTISKLPRVAGIILIAVCISLTASPSPLSFKKAFELASANFMVQHYDIALPMLLDLQQKQPANANISYMIGVCYLNKSLEQFKAIPYLEVAVKNRTAEHTLLSSKEQKAPEISLFHLARAYHFAGRFEEAISLYLDASMTCIKSKKGVANHKLYNDIHRNIDDCKRQMQVITNPETSDAILYY